MYNNLPKISCITAFLQDQNLNHCKRSILYFVKQNYKNKELVLLSQNSFNKELKNYIESLNVDNVLILDVPKRLSLNEINNLAIEVATGTIICQWDHDDHYHPYRLITQYKSLLSNDIIASFYNQFLKYENKNIFWYDSSKEKPLFKSMLPCSVMFYKHAYETYKGKLYSEDFLKKLTRIGILKGVEYAYQYICSKDVTGRILDSDEIRFNQELLSKNLNYYNFDEKIFIHSCDEIIFEKEKNVI